MKGTAQVSLTKTILPFAKDERSGKRTRKNINHLKTIIITTIIKKQLQKYLE